MPIKKCSNLQKPPTLATSFLKFSVSKNLESQNIETLMLRTF